MHMHLLYVLKRDVRAVSRRGGFVPQGFTRQTDHRPPQSHDPNISGQIYS